MYALANAHTFFTIARTDSYMNKLLNAHSYKCKCTHIFTIAHTVPHMHTQLHIYRRNEAGGFTAWLQECSPKQGLRSQIHALAATHTITIFTLAEKPEGLEREMSEAGSVACECT